MAKATVICTCSTCGSEFRVEKICRNRREADSFAAWAENHVDSCRTCKAAARQQEHAAAAAEQSEKDAAIGIAPLHGSEKQIVWATQIRGKAMTVHGAYGDNKG